MYAIFKDGGHQYSAQIGQRINLELRDAAEGDELEFTEVLLVSHEDGVTVGQPTVEGAKVVVKVLKEVKADKVIIRWFRRRKNSRRKNGHRQRYTQVEVVGIKG